MSQTSEADPLKHHVGLTFLVFSLEQANSSSFATLKPVSIQEARKKRGPLPWAWPKLVDKNRPHYYQKIGITSVESIC